MWKPDAGFGLKETGTEESMAVMTEEEMARSSWWMYSIGIIRILDIEYTHS